MILQIFFPPFDLYSDESDRDEQPPKEQRQQQYQPRPRLGPPLVVSPRRRYLWNGLSCLLFPEDEHQQEGERERLWYDCFPTAG